MGFSGALPRELGNLSNLIYLSLSDNRLSGSIPLELGRLQYLAHLDLRRNLLTGTIPADLASLSGLAKLELAGNKLTGCVPNGLRDVLDHDLDDLSLADCIKSACPGPAESLDRNGLVAFYNATGGLRVGPTIPTG